MLGFGTDNSRIMEGHVNQSFSQNDNIVIITRRLHRIEMSIVDNNREIADLRRRFTEYEERVTSNDGIIPEMMNRRAKINNTLRRGSIDSQAIRNEDDEQTHPIINKRVLTFERGIGESSRHLRAIHRRTASLGNLRNASQVNVAFDNAPGDVNASGDVIAPADFIALREIRRGLHLIFLL